MRDWVCQSLTFSQKRYRFFFLGCELGYFSFFYLWLRFVRRFCNVVGRPLSCLAKLCGRLIIRQLQTMPHHLARLSKHSEFLVTKANERLVGVRKRKPPGRGFDPRLAQEKNSLVCPTSKALWSPA